MLSKAFIFHDRLLYSCPRVLPMSSSSDESSLDKNSLLDKIHEDQVRNNLLDSSDQEKAQGSLREGKDGSSGEAPGAEYCQDLTRYVLDKHYNMFYNYKELADKFSNLVVDANNNLREVNSSLQKIESILNETNKRIEEIKSDTEELKSMLGSIDNKINNIINKLDGMGSIIECPCRYGKTITALLLLLGIIIILLLLFQPYIPVVTP